MSSMLTRCSHYFTIPDNESEDGSTVPHPLLAVISYSFFTGLVPHLAMGRTHQKNAIDLFNQSPTFPFITDVLLRGEDIDLAYIKKLIIGDDPAHPRIRFVKRFVLKHCTLDEAMGEFIATSLPFLEWYRICGVGENAEMPWNQELYREDLQVAWMRNSNLPLHAAIYVAAFKHPREEVKANTAWKLGNMLQCYWDLSSRSSIQLAAIPIIPSLFAVLDAPASVIKKETTFENCLWCLRWILTKNNYFHSFLQAQEDYNSEIVPMQQKNHHVDPTENIEDGGKTTSPNNNNQNNTEYFNAELLEGKRFATLRHFIFARCFELKQQVLWVISDLLAERPQMMDAAITYDLVEPILNLLKFDSVVGPSANNAASSNATNFKHDAMMKLNSDEKTVGDDDEKIKAKLEKERKHQQQDIWFAAARVLGDFSQEPQLSEKLIEWHLLECFTPRLDPSQPENNAKIRKELCWCLSNLVVDESIRIIISEKHPLIIKYMCENMKESQAPVIAKEAAFFVANFLNFNHALLGVGVSTEQLKATQLLLDNGAVEGILTFHKTYWTATKRQNLSAGVTESFHPLQRLTSWDCATFTQFFQRVCYAILVRSGILRKEIAVLEQQILGNFESKVNGDDDDDDDDDSKNNNKNNCGSDVLACVDGLLESCVENSEKIRTQLELLHREKIKLENFKTDHERLEISSSVGKSVLLLRNENRMNQVNAAIANLEKILLIFTSQVPFELSNSRNLIVMNDGFASAANGNDKSGAPRFYFQEARLAVEEELPRNESPAYSRIFTVLGDADAQNACFRDLQAEIKSLYLKKINLQTLLRNNDNGNNNNTKDQTIDKIDDEKKLLEVTDDEFGHFIEFENAIWYFPSKGGDEAFTPPFHDFVLVEIWNLTARDHSCIFNGLPARRQLIDFFASEEKSFVGEEKPSNKKNRASQLPSSDEHYDDDDEEEEEEIEENTYEGAAKKKHFESAEVTKSGASQELSDKIAKFFQKTSQELLSTAGTPVRVAVLEENCQYLCALDTLNLFRLGSFVSLKK